MISLSRLSTTSSCETCGSSARADVVQANAGNSVANGSIRRRIVSPPVLVTRIGQLILPNDCPTKTAESIYGLARRVEGQAVWSGLRREGRFRSTRSRTWYVAASCGLQPGGADHGR